MGGYGTPSVFFYHKAFYYISALLLLATGSVKVALTGALAFWMFIGGIGIYLCAAQFTRNRLIKLSTIPLFLLSNYAFVDWLVRGAMAEFAAMMLVPFVLLWCVIVLRGERLAYWIAPILYIVFFAHNILAVFLLPIIVAAYIVAVRRYKHLRTLQSHKNLLISGIITVCAMLPYLVIYMYYATDYSPSSSITADGYTPMNYFVPISQYLYDGDNIWLRSIMDFTTQLDIAVVLICTIGAGLYIWSKVKAKRVTMPSSDKVFMMCILLGLLFLQTSFAEPIYRMIAVMQLIQFPWRLLVIIIPILLCFYAITIDFALRRKYLSRMYVGVVAVLAVGATIFLSPLTHHFQFTFLPEELLEAPITSDLKYISNMGIGEYFPAYVRADGGQPTMAEKRERYLQNTFPAPKDCTVLEITGRTESLRRYFQINCSSSSNVSLPHNYSNLVEVYKDNVRTAYWRTPTDPRIHVGVEEGITVIQINEPQIKTVLKKILHKEGMR